MHNHDNQRAAAGSLTWARLGESGASGSKVWIGRYATYERLHIPELQYKQMLEGGRSPATAGKCHPFQRVFNVNAADREWVNRQCTMQPIATFEQRIQLSGGARNIAHVTFVLANGFVEGSPFPPFYEKAKARGWRTITVSCGHDVMLDRPDELTGILVDVAKEEALAV